MDTTNICASCGIDTNTTREPGSFAAGYGIDPRDNQKYCYKCIGERETKEMIDTGKSWGCLYFNERTHEVTNWPGSVKYKAHYVRKGQHNWWGVNQFYIYFTGPDKKLWYGRLVSGGMNQAFPARRLKIQPKSYQTAA